MLAAIAFPANGPGVAPRPSDPLIIANSFVPGCPAGGHWRHDSPIMVNIRLTM